MIHRPIHILLVSAQAAPNLLPTLDPQLEARKAVLVVTAKMQLQAGHLKRILTQAGIETSTVSLPNETDPVYLDETFLEIGANLEGSQVALNLTGGTKLMALAALGVAREAGWWPFYVDVDTDQVIPLDRSPVPTMPFALATRLGMTHYLGAYGFTRESGATPIALDSYADELLQTLVNNAGSLGKPLGRLNWMAQQAEDRSRLDVDLDRSQLNDPALCRLIDQFIDAGMLDREDRTLKFRDKASRDFTKGGWLERHVFRKVAELSGQLVDASGASIMREKNYNVTVVDPDGVRNELDVAFIARNRLFVIECKTARMDGEQQGSAKANETLFKLSEICRRVGGLGARAMLVSYRPLRETEHRLAKALNIRIVSGREIAALGRYLEEWVS